MSTDEKVLGVVLAGGASRRFGSPKALATIEDQLFWEKCTHILAPSVDNIMILAHPTIYSTIKNRTEYLVEKDLPGFRGQGPLAGIYTAMSQYQADTYLILSSDTPLIPLDFYRKLKQKMADSPDASALVPLVDGRFQPLIAGYRHTTLSSAKELLENRQQKVKNFLDAIKTEFFNVEDEGFSPESFINVNTPEDFEKMIHSVDKS